MASAEMTGNDDNDLELLDRVLLRLGSSDTDEKLEKSVNSFLCPVLLKFGSTNPLVRTKVMEVLTHIQKIVKATQSISLPAEALVHQFGDQDVSPLVLNFNIIFLDMAFNRITTEKQLELLPMLVEILPHAHANHVYTVLRLIVPLLSKVPIPTDPKIRCEMLHLHEKSATRKILCAFLQDVILCDASTALEYRKSNAPVPASKPGATPTSTSTFIAPPGLSKLAVEQATGKGLVTITTDLKCGVVDFVSSGVFPSNEVVISLLIASGDTHHSVASKAENALKRVSEVNWDDPTLVNNVYNLLQGYMPPLQTKSGAKAADVHVDARRTPLSGKVKEKMLIALLKSTRAANVFPQVIQVIYDALFGKASNVRIKLTGIKLMNSVCDHATEHMIKAMGPMLLKGLLQIIKSLSTSPLPAQTSASGTVAPASTSTSEVSKLQSLAYLTIGKLAKCQPDLFSHDVAVLRLLMDALIAQKTRQQSETRLSVMEAIQMVAGAYDHVSMDLTVAKQLDILLSNAMLSDEGNVRLVAVQSARTIFPTSHIGSRYICMIGAGDSQHDVRESALAGLRLPTVHEIPQLGKKASPRPSTSTQTRFPDFEELILYTCKQALTRHADSGLRYQTAMGHMPFPPDIYRSVLLYLRVVLAAQVGHPYAQGSNIINTGANNRHNVHDDIEQYTEEESEETIHDRNKAVSAYLAECYQSKTRETSARQEVEIEAIKALKSTDPITCYRGLAECAWSRAGNSQLYATAAGCLEELALALPEYFSSHYRERVDWLLQFTTSNDMVLRRRVCTVLAVVVTLSKNVDDVVKVLCELKNTCADVRDERHRDRCMGAVTALASIVGRHVFMGRKSALHDNVRVIDTIKESITLVTSFLDLTGEFLLCTLEAVGEMSRYGPLPIENGTADAFDTKEWNVRFASTRKRTKTSTGDTAIATTDSPPLYITKTEITAFLIDILDKARNAKVVDAVIQCLGLVCYGDSTLPNVVVEKILRTLYGKEREKSPDLHFTIGVTLAKIAASSEVAIEPRKESPKPLLESIVTKILQNSISAVPPVRQSAAIWLLNVVKLNSKNKYITQVRIADIQRAFVSFLGDGDEFTQECASNGLGLVYECGDGSLKEELVTTLVSTLSDGAKRTTKLTGETHVFVGDGGLGNAPDGRQLSTYKDLCSLVSELNKPDLIYRFMALSNNNALWQSRKGAAFGFANIASIAGEQLDPYLPQLVPKLYRYKHDPNMKTRTAMGQIWKSLNLEGIETIKKYAMEIFEDLDLNIVHKEWRNREASCLAMADLINTVQTEISNVQFEHTWLMCVRVLDDIKESVRQAGAILSKAVVSLTAKMCDPAVTANKERCREAVAIAVPLLLTKGLKGNVKEVQALSLMTLQKVCRTSGTLILPYATDCVVTLLQQQSELESQSMNYLSFHIEKYDISAEKFEDMRMAASKLSPMAETIEMIVKSLNSSILDEMIPRLLELVKGIGLQTKVGAASLLATLIEPRRELNCSKYIPRVCKALVAGLFDPSPAIRKGYGTSLSYILTSAKDKTSERCIDAFRSNFLDFENMNSAQRLSVAFTVREIGRHSPDHFARFAGNYIPLAYLGCHSDEKDEIEYWTTVWDENTPGTRAGLRLYQDELMHIVFDMLNSSSWQQKRMAAKTAADAVDNIGTALKEPLASKLQATLITALSGRVWDGKEHILVAIGALYKSRAQLISTSDYDAIFRLLLKETSRKTTKYKIMAVSVLGEILRTDTLTNRYSTVQQLLVELSTYTDDMDIDANTTDSVTHCAVAKEKLQSSKETTQVRLAAYKAICSAWKPEIDTQNAYADSLVQHLVKNAPLNVWSVKITILICLTSVLHGLPLSVLNDNTRATLLNLILTSISDGKYSALRLSALKALTTMLGLENKLNKPKVISTASGSGTSDVIVPASSTSSDLCMSTPTPVMPSNGVDITVTENPSINEDVQSALTKEQLAAIKEGLKNRKIDGDPDVRRFSEALLPALNLMLP
eukprot:CFRG5982T1